VELSFLGAAGTVTGSKHLLTVAGKKILVDCGLFQGLKSLRLRNRAPILVGGHVFDAQDLDAIVLTHAHLDHTGFLPVLVKQGFCGPIYCTEPTVDLVQILLRDSGHLQEEDARYANRKGYSRHEPAEPLYTEEEAKLVSPLLRPLTMNEPHDLGGVTLQYSVAGHILGAASAHFSSDEGSVLFSGDLGRPADLLIPAPEPPPEADWVVMESTYGGRQHPTIDPTAALGLAVKRTARRGGVLMVPAFAVGRAQLIVHALAQAFARGDAPRVPVYLNSPMAINVTDLYLKYDPFHRLSAAQCAQSFSVAEYVRKAEDSKELNRRRGPMVLIAGAGMLSGGRILHHLKAFAPDPRNAVLLTGHQAEGTRGATLLHGSRHVKIHGRQVPVRAEVSTMHGLSAHADEPELVDWLGALPQAPRGVFLVHGEPAASDMLRQAVEERLGSPVQADEDGRTISLD
jgi:metallo-beta-lactamase family protein